MSEYTPSTKEIKQAYAEQCGRTWAYCDSGFPEHQREFDRWLARHEEEVRAAERARIVELLNDSC